MTKKKYKVKWCLPVNDVELIDVGSGISINIDKKTTTIKYSQSSMCLLDKEIVVSAE